MPEQQTSYVYPPGWGLGDTFTRGPLADHWAQWSLNAATWVSAFSPIPFSPYKLTWELGMGDIPALPDSTQRAQYADFGSLLFASPDEAFRVPGNTTGYRFSLGALKPQGAGTQQRYTLSLRAEKPGATGVEMEGATDVDLGPGALESRSWYRVEAEVGPTRVAVRFSAPDAVHAIIGTNSDHRGGYFHFYAGSATTAAHFRIRNFSVAKV